MHCFFAGLWHDKDGMYYDQLVGASPDSYHGLKIHSLVALTPIIASTVVCLDACTKLPAFQKHLVEFYEKGMIKEISDTSESLSHQDKTGASPVAKKRKIQRDNEHTLKEPLAEGECSSDRMANATYSKCSEGRTANETDSHIKVSSGTTITERCVVDNRHLFDIPISVPVLPPCPISRTTGSKSGKLLADAKKRKMQCALLSEQPAVHQESYAKRTSNDHRYFLSLVDNDKFTKLFSRMKDEEEFLSPYGIRSLSKVGTFYFSFSFSLIAFKGA